MHNKKNMNIDNAHREMYNVSLVSVNWNMQPAMELMLKSYVAHHWNGDQLGLVLVDNGSNDGSKEWLKENDIPFFDLPENIGHENAINEVYTKINSRIALLVDTDVEFKDNVAIYRSVMANTPGCASVGELIDKNFINEIKIKDRISPWFWMFDIQAMRFMGTNVFRDPSVGDWTYDVGSWHWEKMIEFGFKNANIERFHYDQDNQLVSMPYEKFDHIGKVSWDILNKHQDRIDEVLRRRSYINERLKKYNSIDLKGKFTIHA